MAEDYFISYSRADAGEFTLRLFHKLRAGPPSIPVFLDQDRLPEQSDRRWRPQLANAIKTSAGVLFVVTPDSVMDNSVCAHELEFALAHKKPIILIRLDRQAELPFGLQGAQEVNFSRAYDPATKTFNEEEFGKAVSRLHMHFYWQQTDRAELRALGERLADAERTLNRTKDAAQKARLEKDIATLKEGIARQQNVVRDPEAAARQTAERIDLGIKSEREPKEPGRAAGGPAVRGTRFLYAAPGPVPPYFQDREDETREIGDFLRNEAERLLIVHGRAGMGKTALVCRVLKALADGRPPDDGGAIEVGRGFYLIGEGSHRVTAPDLFAGLRESLPAEAARDAEPLLHDPKADARAKMRALLEAAAEARIVVLLDNFESAIDPATHRLHDRDPELEEALRAFLEAPQHGVKLLVTTQTPLEDFRLIRPERQHYLELPKGLPIAYAKNILRGMDKGVAQKLAGAPDSLLTDACERTGGNPRALEYLVGLLRERDTTLQSILSATEGLLPDAVMDVLVGQLFGRLDPLAQQVMQALAIYGHPVRPHAVDYLLQPYLPSVDSAPVLRRLHNIHAVQKEEGTGRYSLHSIDQEYARGRVPVGEPADRASGELRFTRHALSHRGAEYFRQLRKPREHWMTREDVAPQLAEFDLRRAAGDHDEAARVLREIDDKGLSRWGLNRTLAQRYKQLQGRLADPVLRRDSTCRLGKAYFLIGQYTDAARHFDEAIRLSGELEDRPGAAAALSELGYCHFLLGDLDLAIQEQKQALVMAGKVREQGRERLRLQVNHVLSFIYSVAGQTGLAVKHGKTALRLARRLPDRREESFQLGYLGLYASYLGRTDEALAHDNQALKLAQAEGASREEVLAWANLAEVHTQRGEYAEAIHAAKEALRLAPESESLTAQWSNLWLAVARCLTGDLQGAWVAAEAGCRFDEPLCNQDIWALRGVIALRQGDERAAREAFATAVRQADGLITRCDKNWEALDAKGLALCGLALCEGQDRRREAVRAFEAARKSTRDAGTVRRALLQLDILAPLDGDGLLAPARAAAAGKAPRRRGKSLP